MSSLADKTEIEIDGQIIKIITQAPAYGTHPRYRDRQVVISGVTTLLLENSDEVHACNYCTKPFKSVHAVVAHMGTHFKTSGPATPVATIKAVLRAVKTAERAGERYPMIVAATSLNEQGIETAKGGDWTRAAVANIWHRYRNQYNVRAAYITRRQAPVLADSATGVLDRPTSAPPAPSTMSSPSATRFEVPRQPTARDFDPPAQVKRHLNADNNMSDILTDLARSVSAIDGSWSTVYLKLSGVTSLLNEIKTILTTTAIGPGPDVQQKADAYDKLITKLDAAGLKFDI